MCANNIHRHFMNSFVATRRMQAALYYCSARLSYDIRVCVGTSALDQLKDQLTQPARLEYTQHS